MTTTPNYSQYQVRTLSVVCPVCRVPEDAECLARLSTGEMVPLGHPHSHRVDLAYGIVWYCAACDVKTTVLHIINVLSEPNRIGTCKPVVEIPPEPPPTPEIGTLAQAMTDAPTDDFVNLQADSTTAQNGSQVQIDAEIMTVINIPNRRQLRVTRATEGSTIAAHEAGAEVLIGAPLP